MKNALPVTREENFNEWYQQVIRLGDLAENSSVRGCMIIRPHGLAIWERMQQELDQRFKAAGVKNAYFPLLIPLSSGAVESVGIKAVHCHDEPGGRSQMRVIAVFPG